MYQELSNTIALLARTPAALHALLRDLPEEWTRSNESENTWSPFDIVVHLIHAERTDWMPRVKTILEHGESRDFPPFDRWGEIHESQSRCLAQLLEEFARVRAESLQELRNLDLKPEDMERRGRHPALGSVTLSQLLATWAVHDLNHLHQMSRVMAHQYQEAVGPWADYLGVLKCIGHSS
jgi:hypothetical protein